ncbi:MAG: type ISP restriction/modification enzyme [Candidatus Zixiibacteriota bacterium]
MPPNPISRYLKDIERELNTGRATEHSYRPALKSLLEALSNEISATNEPKRERCGAPDFIVTRGHTPLGYVEAKDIDKNLDEVEKSEQMARYLDGLSNLILTDYLEFRWFERGELRLTASLAKVDRDGKLQKEKAGIAEFSALSESFFAAKTPTIGTPKELAKRMAAIARLIRDITIKSLEDEDKAGSLHAQLDGFRKVLLHDLQPDQFGDMYAQTICYGLFAAKCNHEGGEPFTRQSAAYELPKTNPFLKKMFAHMAGPELDDRLTWAVDDLAELLNRSDMDAILKDFGKRTRREDPVVHFYETFLAAYDPKMREARGVYYTPEPVVSYIVRSVDHILKTDFGIKDGLADTTKIPLYKNEVDEEGKTHRKKVGECHKVLILDPAVGTGTFLHGVIDHIHEHLVETGQAGTWSAYVSEHLLPRLYGFELLMAPYAVAHMKLGLQLSQLGYDFKSGERLRIYLTNTLEKAKEKQIDVPFANMIAEEANSAVEIKSENPVMVILGNPPYSGHSANKGDWIKDLLHGKDSLTEEPTANYFEVDGKPLGERNPKWLNDDYVKFIRFAQWRIERTGYGILSFISNHSYLDSPTFRGMRQSLMSTFDDIFILDLHGNTKKREVCPDGSKDENVFDIQQGVAIGTFVRKDDSPKSSTLVNHAHLWGLREERSADDTLTGGKYHWLGKQDCSNTDWAVTESGSPDYMLVPQDDRERCEYYENWDVSNIMTVKSVGVVTARDKLTIHWDRDLLWQTVVEFARLTPEVARARFRLGPDAQDWKVSMAIQDIDSTGPDSRFIKPILYRPFDIRYSYYTGRSRGFICRPRAGVMRHLVAGSNLALTVGRAGQVIDSGEWNIVFCSSSITEFNLFRRGGNNIIPLYVFADDEQTDMFKTDTPPTKCSGRRPNLAPEFIDDFSRKIKMRFISDGKGDLKKTFGPEDVFSYMYAIFHSPTYRSRYAEFLKIDFPRLPLTSRPPLFRDLCALGEQLVGLHLMEKHGPGITSYPVDGDHTVEKVRYTEPSKKSPAGRVWINKTQYFGGVPPEVWEFHIGGYQVCHKWLKDRKGRKLGIDDLTHYQHIVSALSETIRLMSEIDQAIDKHGGWPIQ